MTSDNIKLESPNVKADCTGQTLLTYEEIVEQIHEKIQVQLCIARFFAPLHLLSFSFI